MREVWRELFWTIALLLFGCGRLGYDIVSHDGSSIRGDSGVQSQDASAEDSNMLDGSAPPARLALKIAPRVVADSTYTGQQPSLLWLGDRYGLLWQDGALILDGSGSSPRPRYITMDAAGTPLSAVVNAAPAPRILPHAVWTGNAIALVTIGDHRQLGQVHDVELRMLDAQGAPLGAPIAVSAGPSRAPRIAWTGTSFGVTSSYSVSLGRLDVVSSAGEITASAGPITGSGDCTCSVDIAWSGSAFIVGYDNDGFRTGGGYDTLISRYDRDAIEIGSRIAAYPELGSTSTRVAYGHGQVAVAFHHNRLGPILSRVSTDGNYIDSTVLETAGPPEQYFSAVALEVIPAQAALPRGGFAFAYFLLRSEVIGTPGPVALRVVLLDDQGQRVDAMDVIDGPNSAWPGSFNIDLKWNGDELGVAFAIGLDRESEVYFAVISI